MEFIPHTIEFFQGLLLIIVGFCTLVALHWWAIEAFFNSSARYMYPIIQSLIIALLTTVVALFVSVLKSVALFPVIYAYMVAAELIFALMVQDVPDIFYMAPHIYCHSLVQRLLSPNFSLFGVPLDLAHLDTLLLGRLTPRMTNLSETMLLGDILILHLSVLVFVYLLSRAAFTAGELVIKVHGGELSLLNWRRFSEVIFDPRGRSGSVWALYYRLFLPPIVRGLFLHHLNKLAVDLLENHMAAITNLGLLWPCLGRAYTWLVVMYLWRSNSFGWLLVFAVILAFDDLIA
ncbi:hypothetical protein B0T16DRAFT_457233 [Cercophora newfieldiana]|uniref:Uncharacterized protein n=1 Tax=Cercophora newfieldiana TaxID=92897 RepID=A0AA39YC07_9PEZI|nr:hypothetical protein B0T16DRAFT_457233 [Cercophora newfieldiana]